MIPPTTDATIVVVPCFNEAARLDLAAYDAFLECADGIDLLMVDDGSVDDTPQVLERLRGRHPSRVSVLRLGRNSGKAEAVRRGVQAALGRRPALVGYWDADLATPLEAIVQFRAVLAARPELALVMGSRVPLLGRAIQRRPARRLLGRAFATAASLALGLAVYDTQCGAKLFRATPLVTGLFQLPFRARWVFDVELLARLAAATRGADSPPVEELVYEYPLERWQDVGGSRLTPRDFAVAALDLAMIGWRYRKHYVAPSATAVAPARREAA